MSYLDPNGLSRLYGKIMAHLNAKVNHTNLKKRIV